MTPARSIVLSACILAGLLALIIACLGRKGAHTTHDGARHPTPGATSDQASIARSGPVRRILAETQALNAPSSSPQGDAIIVRDLIGAYRRFAKGNPTGDNDEITAQLLGRRRGAPAVMLIDPGNPAIDPAGRLVDRWGTPYFFHAVSASVMEVRSAGPDQKLWTPDDIVGE